MQSLSLELGMGPYGLGYVFAVVIMILFMTIPIWIVRTWGIDIPAWLFLPFVVIGGVAGYTLELVDGWWMIAVMVIVVLMSVSVKVIYNPRG